MKYTDRDLSWLSFNERILQEAASPRVPLMERLKFVAIYSSNLEEFYKVRVASHRFAQKYRGDKKNKFGYRPSFILQQINLTVSAQQKRLGSIFWDGIVPELAGEGIHLLKDQLTAQDRSLIGDYYDENLAGRFSLVEITGLDHLELKNQVVYLYFLSGSRSFLLELDYPQSGRFITLSDQDGHQRIIQLDDIFKENREKFIAGDSEAYAVKISRDAELYIDEEQDDDIVKKIKKSIRKRDTGMPARLLFDEDIAFKHIDALRQQIGVDMSGLIPGGRYHNFFDFFAFPQPAGKPHLDHIPIPKVPCHRLDHSADWFAEVKREDIFLSFPYQDYSYVSEFLNRAADDPQVTEINITLYRVARDSSICQALERAAQGGKKVFVLTEVQARFDEESNIYWGERLEKAGAKVLYGVDDLKVHAKIFTVKREEGSESVTYSYLGTGNFNEKTAGIYGDHALISADEAYALDLQEVFHFLQDRTYAPSFSKLLVAPFNLRKQLNQMIKGEMAHAKSGQEARITFKMNSLEDLPMIDRLREAADAGVRIDLIVRGICCYRPLSALQAQNIRVVSVVDHFLEHTRIYHFHNGGVPQTFLASADLMKRNLSKRVEVGFPIQDEKTRLFLLKQMDLQLNDGIKGRRVAVEAENSFVEGGNDRSAQEMLFELVAELNPTFASETNA